MIYEADSKKNCRTISGAIEAFEGEGISVPTAELYPKDRVALEEGIHGWGAGGRRGGDTIACDTLMCPCELRSPTMIRIGAYMMCRILKSLYKNTSHYC